MRGRVKRLEDKGHLEACPTCGGKIIVGEEQEDGTVVWEGDGPCGECGSRPTHSSQVTRIVVVYGDAEGGEGPSWP